MTTLPATEVAELAAQLTDDGDIAELPDGSTLRLRIEPDEGMTAGDDADWHGPIAWDDRGAIRRAHDYGRPTCSRPAGFDGNAEVIERDGGARLWWQLPEDVKRGTDLYRAMRAALVDLIEYGYRVVVLEVLKGEDAYGRPIVADVASLGGIEPFPDREYVAEVVAELLAELGFGE